MTPAAPWGVVLVPTEAGRALLADGPCGAMPPLVSRYPDGTSIDGIRLDVWAVDHGRHAHGRRSRVMQGLPLRWDGAPVPEGVFRAWLAWSPDETRAAAAFEATGWTTYDVLAESLDGSPGAALWLARELKRAGLCRVVVLDLVDGAVRERAP